MSQQVASTVRSRRSRQWSLGWQVALAAYMQLISWVPFGAGYLRLRQGQIRRRLGSVLVRPECQGPNQDTANSRTRVYLAGSTAPDSA